MTTATAPSLTPALDPADPRPARVRLRADIALAARVLAPLWPLERFIAVNPLGGLERRPFEDAVRASAAALGARGTLDETTFRAEHARGRITDADLRRALVQRLDLAAGRTIALGGEDRLAVDLLRVDLLHGAPAAALRRATATQSARFAPAIAASIDQQTSKWCSAYFDEGQAAWTMPRHPGGLYASWHALAGADRSLPRAARQQAATLPARADDALLWALGSLRIAPADQRGYLQTHLACLPGWAGHVRFRADQHAGDDLVDFLALRLVLEALLLRAPAPAATPEPAADQAPALASRARKVAAVIGVLAEATPEELLAVTELLDLLPARDRPFVWLSAHEGNYRDALLTSLEAPARAQGSSADAPSHAQAAASAEAPSRGQAAATTATATASERPAAQVICCIDTRSEGLRRQLEARGSYDTLGFAGFFAVAIRFHELGGRAATDLCPVLISPSNEIHEQAAAGAERAARRKVAGDRTIEGAERSFHAAKDDLLGPFALAETSGWIAGPAAAARTFAAGTYGAARSRMRQAVAPPAPTALTIQDGFTLDQQTMFAEVALRMMGLVEGFAPLVALCGHGSSTDNNPYASALECGACGGQSGGPNARAAAAILNGQAVRDHLRTRGIDIPADTWFVAAEHDTASDRVVLLDPELLPDTHQDGWHTLQNDLALAGSALAVERCAELPGAPSGPTPQSAARHVRARGTDWAQVYPEWGLAGNAAFIVGPRSITRGVDLQRRAFLHSYEATADPTGSGLETILTAPLVVAQWINCQYYFSAVDPQAFGAGTKTTHNVVGGIGVLTGAGGDLRRGLPWQSVGVGDRLVHEPLRLLAAVQAPLERIEEIVQRNTILQHLFDHGWVALVARSSETEPWCRRTQDGWQPWATTKGEDSQ